MDNHTLVSLGIELQRKYNISENYKIIQNKSKRFEGIFNIPIPAHPDLYLSSDPDPVVPMPYDTVVLEKIIIGIDKTEMGEFWCGYSEANNTVIIQEWAGHK